MFFVARDPVVIERSNLVNISKLIVKELIEQSLRYGRMLDSDHLPLHHFFIVLEHVMRHGLKPKKVNLVQQKKKPVQNQSEAFRLPYLSSLFSGFTRSEKGVMGYSSNGGEIFARGS